MHIARLPGREFRSGEYRSVVRTPYFIIKTKRNDVHMWRVGVVAGAGVHKSAVKRNFWKRQARETLRALIAQSKKLPSGPSWDILMVLHPKVTTLTKKHFGEILRAGARPLA